MLSFLYEIDIFAGSTQFYSIAVILNIARIVNTVLPQVTVCLICLVCLCLEHLNPRYLLTMPLSQTARVWRLASRLLGIGIIENINLQKLPLTRYLENQV